MNLKCRFTGEGASIVGSQTIDLDFDHKVLSLHDSGGLFGGELHKKFNLEECRFLFVGTVLKYTKVIFACPGDYNGSFQLNLVEDPEKFHSDIKSNLSQAHDLFLGNLVYTPLVFQSQFLDQNLEELKVSELPESVKGNLQLSIEGKRLVLIPCDADLGIFKHDDAIKISVSRIKEIEEFDDTYAIYASVQIEGKIFSAFHIPKLLNGCFVEALNNAISEAVGSNSSKVELNEYFLVSGNWESHSCSERLVDMVFNQEGNLLVEFLDHEEARLEIPLDCLDDIELLEDEIIMYSEGKGLIHFQGHEHAWRNIFNNNARWLNLLYDSNFSNDQECHLIGNLIEEEGYPEFKANQAIVLRVENKEISACNGSLKVDSLNLKRYSLEHYLDECRIDLEFSEGRLLLRGTSSAITQFETRLAGELNIDLNGINSFQFQFEQERKCLDAARKSFVAENALKDLYERIHEPTTIPDLIGKSVLVNDKQFPDVYRKVAEASAQLGIDPPECYIYESFFYKCDSEGLVNPRIQLTSKVIEDFEEDELKFMIGRSVAHIALGHMEPEVKMEGVLNLLPGLGAIPGVGSILSAVKALDATQMVLKVIYYNWSRSAAFSADRYGFLFSGSLKSSVNAILKLILNSEKLFDELNVQNYLMQCQNVASHRGIVSFYAKADESVPYGMDRVNQLFKYSQSLTGKMAVKKIKLLSKKDQS
ncbi:M48 family metallopeptidase [Mariniblastus sp.]|nr:M48 family metallopeptidase [Mariniblastus sp.]